MLLIAGAIVAIIVSPLSLTDCFAVALAIVPTGWGLISVSYLFTFISFRSCPEHMPHVLNKFKF